MGLDQRLEDVLKSIFEVESKKAEQAAKISTLEEFELNFRRLENLLDFKGAAEVVRLGEFLAYRNSQLDKYFQLAYLAIGKMDAFLPVPIKPFYSVTTLKEYLGIKEEDSKVIDHSKLKLASYRILHIDHPMSVAFLESLIENGEVVVGDNDRWSRSKSKEGPRGPSILRRIAFELVEIFNDLEMNRPQYDINFGQSKITLDRTTSEALRKVRDSAYSLQR